MASNTSIKVGHLLVEYIRYMSLFELMWIDASVIVTIMEGYEIINDDELICFNKYEFLKWVVGFTLSVIDYLYYFVDFQLTICRIEVLNVA